MNGTPLDALTAELRARVGDAFEVDPPEFDRVDVCSRATGFEIQIFRADSGYRLTADLYALAPAPEERRPGAPPKVEVSPRERLAEYVPVIQALFDGGFRDAGWTLTDIGRWFMASSSPDDRDDLLGYEIEITQSVDGLDALCEIIRAADRQDAWSMIQ